MDFWARDRRRSIVVSAAQRRRFLACAALPALGLALATVVVSFYCRGLLTEADAARTDLPSLLPLNLSVLGFIVLSGGVVMHQARRFSHRIAGPTYRISRAMRRVRDGDIGFRIALREDDYLGEIADEFNLLLDWLNEHPPDGASLGGDIVDLVEEDCEVSRLAEPLAHEAGPLEARPA